MSMTAIMKTKNASRLLMWSLTALCLTLAQPLGASEYQILISKQNNELLIEKAGEVVKRFHIATGKGGKGAKRRQGDSKTPVGTYRILKFKQSDRFHYFIQLDYPNLIDAWYGYKNEVISANEFKRIAHAYKKREAPPQDTALGGFIGIHGLGQTTQKKLQIHENLDWTEGCIALTNEEVLELKNFVDVGTQVVIVE